MSWTQSPTEDIAVVSKGRLSTLVLMSVAFRMLTDILEGPTSGKITPLM